jgi:hypothetical protein
MFFCPFDVSHHLLVPSKFSLFLLQILVVEEILNRCHEVAVVLIIFEVNHRIKLLSLPSGKSIDEFFATLDIVFEFCDFY